MSDFLQRSSAGSFYVNAGTETVVDPFGPPLMQNQLLDQLRGCDQLVQLDFRYAKIVQGASKMPWNMVWAARNQDEPVSDADLAELRDLAWNEIIKKRYLPSLSGTATVGETTASMLEIVRDMNLQRRRFQIMGLHEQVEACEIHLVLQLCQAGILFSDRYRVMANRFRRHEKLFEAFGLAVGAFVCASAPFTLGSGMARYERDLQYEYRKNATALFVWVLQQNMAGLDATAVLDEDYVARISRLIVVWPDDDDGRKKKKRIGFEASKKDDDGGSARINMLLDAVAVAQGDADKARMETERINIRIDGWQKSSEDKIEKERANMRSEITEKAAEVQTELRGVVSGQIGELRTQLQIDHRVDVARIEGQITEISSRLRAMGESHVQRSERRPENIEAERMGRFGQLERDIELRLIATETNIRARLEQTELEMKQRLTAQIESELQGRLGDTERRVMGPASSETRPGKNELTDVSTDDLYHTIEQFETDVISLKEEIAEMQLRLNETTDNFEEITDGLAAQIEPLKTERGGLDTDFHTQIKEIVESDNFMSMLNDQIQAIVNRKVANLQRRAVSDGQAAGAVNDTASIITRLQTIEDFLSITGGDEATDPVFGPPLPPLGDAKFPSNPPPSDGST